VVTVAEKRVIEAAIRHWRLTRDYNAFKEQKKKRGDTVCGFAWIPALEHSEQSILDAVGDLFESSQAVDYQI
jgi:hypothetical protein